MAAALRWGWLIQGWKVRCGSLRGGAVIQDGSLLTCLVCPVLAQRDLAPSLGAHSQVHSGPFSGTLGTKEGPPSGVEDTSTHTWKSAQT